MHPCQSYHYCLKKFFILDLFLCCLGSSLKMLTVGEREQKFSFFSSRCSCYFQLERSSKKKQNNPKLKKNWKTLMTGKFKRSEHKKPVSFNIERWMRRIRIWKYITFLPGPEWRRLFPSCCSCLPVLFVQECPHVRRYRKHDDDKG